MIAVLIIVALTCATMFVCVLIKPCIKVKSFNVGLYWVIALVGATVLLASGLITFAELFAGLLADTAVNPLKILVLFISMTVLSIFLDEVGLFGYIANEVLKRSKANQKVLFLYLYLVVSILTIFTSNDIVILTFTPFICYFAKNAKINPIPYLICEFVAANTWSMALIIGNPTNIYLAVAEGINFWSYFKVMALPTFFGGVVAYIVLYLIFRKTLSKDFIPVATDVQIKSKALLLVGILHLVLCTLLLALSSIFGWSMWIIALSFAVSLFIIVLLYKLVKKQKPTELWHCIKLAPWELVPFILSMFVMVLALSKYGITEAIGQYLGAGSLTLLKYGVGSVLFANFINNIPMSVLFGSVLQTLPMEYATAGIFATIAGANIGAFLTPVGALAGIMWAGILRAHDVKLSFARFVLFGFAVAVPSLLATLGGLYIVLGV